MEYGVLATHVLASERDAPEHFRTSAADHIYSITKLSHSISQKARETLGHFRAPDPPGSSPTSSVGKVEQAWAFEKAITST